jgi:hypothetical protein
MDTLELVKISELDEAGSISENGYFPISQAGVTSKVKLKNLANFMLFNIAGINEPYLYASDKRKLRLRGYDDIELNVPDILDTGGSLINGKDYYLFECPPVSGTRVYKVSTSKTAPLGFTAGNVELIGGFHTLCANAGTLPNYTMGDQQVLHPASGYVAGDIIPISVWCLNHRPYSEPEGMAYCYLGDFWFDIYLQSGSGMNTKSAYQEAITRSRQYVDFVEDMACVKKELLSDSEFAMIMLGSNEQTAVAGANEAGATTGGAGGRVDTAGCRMISAFFAEEGCGSLWQYLRSADASGYQGVMYQQTTTVPAYGQVTITTSNHGPYDQSGGGGNFASGKGKIWGVCGALIAGGSWSDAAGCGSRSRGAPRARACAHSGSGGRGRSRPMR